MRNFRERYSRELGMFALLVGLVIFTAAVNPNFVSLDNFRNVTRTIGTYGILSIGVGIVIITAGIDLSIGSLMALLGILFFYMLTGEMGWIPQLPWPLAVLAVIVIGLLVGLAHGFFIGKMKMQAFVVTLCGLLSYRGIARTISDDSVVGYSSVSDGMGMLKALGDGTLGSLFYGSEKGDGLLMDILYAVPMTLVYLLVVATVMAVVLHRSVYGRYLFATGRNEAAARYSGINTTLVIGSAYVICAGLAAFAAVPYAIFTASASPSGHAVFIELYAIAGAVLGGCALKGGEGTIIGILIGTAILILLQNMVNMFGAPSPLTDVITGGVLFVGVLLNQIGIAGLKRMIGLGGKR